MKISQFIEIRMEWKLLAMMRTPTSHPFLLVFSWKSLAFRLTRYCEHLGLGIQWILFCTYMYICTCVRGSTQSFCPTPDWCNVDPLTFVLLIILISFCFVLKREERKLLENFHFNWPCMKGLFTMYLYVSDSKDSHVYLSSIFLEHRLTE